MLDASLPWKLVALLSFSACAVALDFRKPATERHRWREYSVLLGGTAAGMLLGLTIDAITSVISPDYFEYGKQVLAGPGFEQRVLVLGAEAGAGAGVLASGVLLVANRDPSRSLVLLRYTAYPIVGALSVGPLLGLLQWQGALVTLTEWREVLGEQKAAAFTVVWLTHIGVYAGALLGLMLAVLTLRKHSSEQRDRSRGACADHDRHS